MAAIDGVLSHLVGYRDIILSSRNIYGGAFQLLHDWFRKPSNLDVAVVFFDGYSSEAFQQALARVKVDHAARLTEGKQIYIYLESPCNPHGYVLDVPAICRIAHEHGLTVILDGTIATPFLAQPMQLKEAIERPDFLIHSYTKDISGTGTVTAGE
jgi:O-acetylhomoserine (thiol)-lyase